MSDVIDDKPKDKFNFREFLEGLDNLAAQTEKCDDPDCPACHPETAPKDDGKRSDFMNAVLSMPDKDQAHNAKTLKWVANNLENLGLMLMMKQMGDKPVFKDQRAIESVLTSLTLGSMIVSTFAGSVEKMTDEQFEQVKAGLKPKQ